MNSSLILNQSGFVLANARVLAAASQAAYGPESYSEPPHVGCYENKTTGTHVNVTSYDDCTVIAFRGTASLRDWITDAEFPLRPLPDTKTRVHEGFLTAVNSVLGYIVARVGQASSLSNLPAGDRLDAGPILKPILLTGHSLGGALAVLAAWYLQQQGLTIHSVYTFGQPRVGDRAFAAAYRLDLADRTYRVVNQNDLVPRVPGVLLGYRHAGELVFLNALGELVLNPSWVGRVISDGLGLYRAYRRLDDVLITDHFVAGYVAALSQVEMEIAHTEANTANTQLPDVVSRLPL